MFLVLLLLALCTVAWCARFAYREGLLLEATKANAQALAAWVEQLAEPKGMPLTLARCASVSDHSPALQGDADWSSCRLALLGEGGPLAHLSNPFKSGAAVLGSKCEKRNPASRGLVVVEKGTNSPPGMPVSVTWEPLGEDDTLARGLLLRVQACDAGGYAIKIGEFKL